MGGRTGDRARLTPEAWRRIGTVLDRVSAADSGSRASVLADACRAEGLRPEDVQPFLTPLPGAPALPERLDHGTLENALRSLVDGPPRGLPLGTRIDSYEIEGPVGAGGMGEVYRARDTRLDRTVALKRLHCDLAAGASGRDRFAREARAIARLNHPHICTLFDVVEQDGTDFLVMELVEGESLAARLQRGPLGIAQAVQCSIQIADALAAAHRQGIVHRDLKPANIMLTPRGVKLLDFGLATLRDADAADAGTGSGAMLGTPGYTSPEQLQGGPVDARTDIFALGAVIYEMLTGSRAFAGGSSAEIAVAILDREPEPLSARRDDVPVEISRAIDTCLAKRPDDRWQSAADLARHLSWTSAPDRAAPGISRSRAGIGKRTAVAAIVVAAVAIAALWGIAPRLSPQPATPPLTRFALAPPPGHTYDRMHALSPDGKRLAFVTLADDRQRALWVRALDALEPQRIAGSEGASYPFWSPDGQFIGFFADNALKKVDTSSGRVETICQCDTGTGGGGTWNRDGVILFSKGLVVSPLWQVPASGGTAAVLTPLNDALRPMRNVNAWPQFLPDGHRFLWLTGSDDRSGQGIYAGQLGTTDRVRVMEFVPGDGAAGRRTRGWYAGGYLFFVRNQALMAQQFSLERLELTGEPVRVVEQVQQSAPGRSIFDVAPGVIAYREPLDQRPQSQLVWLDRAGRETGRIGAPMPISTLALSPDGRHILASGPSGLVRIDTATGIPTPLRLNGQSLVWAPDGTRFALAGGAAPGPFPSTASVDAPEDVRALQLPGTGQAWPTDWSPDGRYLIGHVLHADTYLDRWAVDTKAEPLALRYLVRAPGSQQDQRVSPDGRWVAYASNESNSAGPLDVFVEPFPEGPGRRRVSLAGGRLPTWTPDGRQLLYVAPDGTLMSAAVRSDRDFSAAPPRPLFRHDALRRGYLRELAARPYDVSRSGRILLAVPLTEPLPPPIIVLLNWERLLAAPQGR
jgi:eukaryotic-like serine/threonine-protein kinase